MKRTDLQEIRKDGLRWNKGPDWIYREKTSEFHRGDDSWRGEDFYRPEPVDTVFDSSLMEVLFYNTRGQDVTE